LGLAVDVTDVVCCTSPSIVCENDAWLLGLSGMLSYLAEKIRLFLRLPPKVSPLISVVLHFRRPMNLSDEAIHSAIEHAWKRDIREDLNEHVVNKPPICFVKFDGMMVMLSSVHKPYCPVENLDQALAEFPEMRQKKIIREHRAFLAIDLLYPENPTKTMKQECYRRMCLLAADFVDDNCMGIYLPEIGHMRPFDADVISALRSDKPLEEIQKWGEGPVMMIEEDDPRLMGLVAEARRRWPEFVQAFQRQHPNQSFSVKALFTDGDHGEWMWIVVSSINGEMIEGTLGNEPVEVKNIREGDRVKVRASEIGDWGYRDGNQLVGCFTLTASQS
jgi:uncharacterized protein YegJ (DUF2314 family)